VDHRIWQSLKKKEVEKNEIPKSPYYGGKCVIGMKSWVLDAGF